jgi:hypothetical protein
MKKSKIEDDFIEKNGRQIKKVKLLWVDGDEDKVFCDGCDEKKSCAHIDDINGNVMVICIDCLKEIIDSF